MTRLRTLFLLTVALLRDRFGSARPSRDDGDRGASGNTLEIVLLAVGALIVGIIVVIAVKSSMDNRTGPLKPN